MSFIAAHETLGFVGSADLLRVFKIGEKTEPKEAFSWDQLQPELIKKPDFQIRDELLHVSKREILCLAHSNTHHWLAVGTNEYQVHVIEYFLDAEGNFARSQHLITAIVRQRPTDLTFDKNDISVTVGHFSGDIYRFAVSEGKAADVMTDGDEQGFFSDGRETLDVVEHPQTPVIMAFWLRDMQYEKAVVWSSLSSIWVAKDNKLSHWSLEEPRPDREWTNGMKNPTEPLATVDLSEYGRAIRKIAYLEEHMRLAILLEEPQDRLIFADVSDCCKAHLSVFQILQEGQYLDVTTVGDKFVVLGRCHILVFDSDCKCISTVKLMTPTERLMHSGVTLREESQQRKRLLKTYIVEMDEHHVTPLDPSEPSTKPANNF